MVERNIVELLRMLPHELIMLTSGETLTDIRSAADETRIRSTKMGRCDRTVESFPAAADENNPMDDNCNDGY
jgi:hypothetical protein